MHFGFSPGDVTTYADNPAQIAVFMYTIFALFSEFICPLYAVARLLIDNQTISPTK
jgi:hypothetical protein